MLWTTWLPQWMDSHCLGSGPVTDVVRLQGGTQNILTAFSRSGRRYVLRRPPEVKRPTSDETMRREAQLLAGLAGTQVPHPRLIAAEPDESVAGAAFYLMEPIEGFVASEGWPPGFTRSAARTRRVGLSAVDALAALSRVDPTAVGLNGLGRPGDFLERQVSRWRWQLESYVPGPGYVGLPMVAVDRLADWLERNRPDSAAPAILHGDYHLGNVMLQPETGSIAAIVDWELVTIGDPLLDLAHFLVAWPAADGSSPMAEILPVSPAPGMASEAAIAGRYQERSGRDLGALAWYEVLAAFRLAVILEGSMVRASRGDVPAVLGERFHRVALRLLAYADLEVAA